MTQSEVAPGSEAQARVTAVLSQTRGVTRRLGELVLTAPEWLVNATVADTAQRLETSASSVMRATRRLNFSGFDNLRTVLLRDQGRASVEPKTVAIAPPNEVADALASALRLAAVSITDALNTVSIDAFVRAVDLIADASKIVLVGAGTSRTPIEDAERRLLTLGLNVSAPTDQWTQEVLCRQLGPSDVCIAVSRNGKNQAAVVAARFARRCGATVIGLSSYENTPLSREAHINLYAGAPELGFMRVGISSQLAVLSVLHALYVALMIKLPHAADRAADAIYTTTERNVPR